ncbi:MAG: paraquat-inducible protein A [Pseudomonadota bacterium]
MSTTQRITTLLLIVIAISLLYPGVTQPALTLSGSVEKSQLVELGIDLLTDEGGQSQTRQMLTTLSNLMGLNEIEGQLQVYSSTRSIWGTAEGLASNGYLAVALLVVLFSMVVPTFKLLLQATAVIASSSELRAPLLQFNAALSKWSMADVFLMGLLVAYMAGGAAEQTDEMLIMHASLGPGFFFFMGYCLFSIIAGSMLLRALRQTARETDV